MKKTLLRSGILIVLLGLLSAGCAFYTEGYYYPPPQGGVAVSPPVVFGPGCPGYPRHGYHRGTSYHNHR